MWQKQVKMITGSKRATKKKVKADSIAQNSSERSPTIIDILNEDCWKVVLSMDFEIFQVELLSLISKRTRTYVRSLVSSASHIPELMPYDIPVLTKS